MFFIIYNFITITTMTTMVSSTLRQNLIDIINRNLNVNYTISNINTIRFTLHMISIWMDDENRLDIKYNILNSIELSVGL